MEAQSNRNIEDIVWAAWKHAEVHKRTDVTLQITLNISADEVVAVFAPNRYEIPEYRGYDITKLKDNYRCGIILKSRDGEANIRGHFFFDGAVSRFDELPKAAEMSQDDYEYYANRVNRSVNTISFS